MDLSLVITILDRVELNRIRQLYEKNDIAPLLTALGNGTATKSQLSLLGLKESEKALIAGVIGGDDIKPFFRQAKREMMIDVPGNGVMMTVPLKSIGGGRTLRFLTGDKEMDNKIPELNFENELIIVITNGGYTDDVMDVAREAGAGGGTVLHAKGTGARLANKFFGVSLAEEKEVILIAERSATKTGVMKAIAEKTGPSTPAGAIAFSVPITEIAGIRVLE